MKTKQAKQFPSWENIFSTWILAGHFFEVDFSIPFEPPFGTRNFPQVEPELPRKIQFWTRNFPMVGAITQFATVQRSWNDTWTSWTGWVGCSNPSEKYDRQNGFIFPNFRDENLKKSKPPPGGLMEVHRVSYCWWFRNPANSPVAVKKTRLFEIHPRWLAGLFHQQYQPVTALRHRCVAASWPVQTR